MLLLHIVVVIYKS